MNQTTTSFKYRREFVHDQKQILKYQKKITLQDAKIEREGSKMRSILKEVNDKIRALDLDFKEKSKTLQKPSFENRYKQSRYILVKKRDRITYAILNLYEEKARLEEHIARHIFYIYEEIKCINYMQLSQTEKTEINVYLGSITNKLNEDYSQKVKLLKKQILDELALI